MILAESQNIVNFKPCATFPLFDIYLVGWLLCIISHLPVCCRDVLATSKVGHWGVYCRYELHTYVCFLCSACSGFQVACPIYRKTKNQTDQSNLPWHVSITCILNTQFQFLFYSDGTSNLIYTVLAYVHTVNILLRMYINVRICNTYVRLRALWGVS